MNGKYTLYEIDTPIILVIGISKELNDFSQLQAMKQKLEEEGYASLIMWLYKLFRGFVKISFNEVCGVYERKTIIILHTLN